MKTIVFFLEEPSAREMLEGVLPRILPDDFQIRYLVFRGKQDLEINLKKRLRGWRLPDPTCRLGTTARTVSISSFRESESWWILILFEIRLRRPDASVARRTTCQGVAEGEDGRPVPPHVRGEQSLFYSATGSRTIALRAGR